MALPPAVPLPAYGFGSLAEVVPSLFAALGAPGCPNDLEVPSVRAAVLFVVDGLGWELLGEFADDAPFLTGHRQTGRSITSGYPSSTATSLAMLSTGRPPIAHGLTGYTMAAPGLGRAMNNLAWAVHGPEARDLRDELPPEDVQPLPTVFQLAEQLGIGMTAVGPGEHVGSGLTRAILRGGRYVPVRAVDDDAAIEAIRAALHGPGYQAVYTYEPTVDAAGHRHGPGSDPWRAALRRVDAVAARLAELLPPETLLAVTADHGMVDLSEPGAERPDLADRPDLAAGVRFVAGEARARHVHVDQGQAGAVLARWRDALGHAAWVLPRDEAIEDGWFGPLDQLREPVRERIGDVVAAAFGPLGVFQRLVDPGEASLAGHHGSLTSAELLVPWIVVAP
ncbi:MAG TPA: alkaline phosphatase family protein [Vitreimonas sp.]|nr:alkaline phosphatase family protein [Vitreimonas sp.]